MATSSSEKLSRSLLSPGSASCPNGETPRSSRFPYAGKGVTDAPPALAFLLLSPGAPGPCPPSLSPAWPVPGQGRSAMTGLELGAGGWSAADHRLARALLLPREWQGQKTCSVVRMGLFGDFKDY